MTKSEFLSELRGRLSTLPQSDITESVDYYSEIIDERIDEGMSEEEAVEAVGSVGEIAAQILGEADTPKSTTVQKKPRRRLSAFEITLLILGAPIWFSLLVAAFAVILSLYASIWSVIISLWAAFGALAVGAVGIIISAVGLIFCANTLSGVAMVGAGIACAGLSIFLFYGCKAATKGTLTLTKNIAIGIKKRLSKKEAA